MMIDARLLPADVEIDTEVCIVGSGPAGLSLAREFAGQNFRVCLLESGGLGLPDADTQSLAEVETKGDFVQVSGDRRNRRFGGNSSYWAIQLGNGYTGLRHRPFDEVDFEKRDWVPHSGWPFDRSHLMPYYERAQAVFKMGPFAYEADDWEDLESPRLPFVGDRVTTRIFQFSPGAAFYQEYRHEINRASNITTYYHANAVELETNDTARTVKRVRVASLQGNQFWVSAKIVILAVGGIEGAQLLLLSNQVQKEGLGNEYDLVGRFFIDHPLVHGGLFVPSDPNLFNRTALYDKRQVNGVTIMGALGLTDEVMRREKLPNISAKLFPRPMKLRPYPAVSSLKAIATLQSLRGGNGLLQDLGTVISHADEITATVRNKLARTQQPFLPNLSMGNWSHLQDNRDKVYEAFSVLHQTEQLPHPDNRVVLSEHCDKLGRRKIQMQTRWRDADIEGIKRGQAVMAEEIARAGLGQFIIEREKDGSPILATAGTSHHMGTTRMHTDCKQGVVDENCRVHSVSNLYIASSSVFPTGGYANPTLTIVAMAIRLADEIKAVMAQPATELNGSLVLR